MGWPSLLVMVRHAESEGNVRSVDERAAYECATYAYHITERGQRQSRITAEFLNAKYDRFDVRYTSYYNRAKETMAILCPGEKVYEDSRLAEAQRGVFHVLTETEIEQCMPWELKRKEREGLYHFRPAGGENWMDVEQRIHSFLGTLSRDYDGQKVLIVVHGHWLILFKKLVHHFSIQEAIDRYHSKVAKNTAVTVYRAALDDRGHSRLQLVIDDYCPWEGKL